MRILVAGDFAPKCRIATKIEAGDYSCLEEIRPIIQKADYSIVNFESPVVTREAMPIEKTGPNLRCTEQAMECLVHAGFNCVTLANNHFRDYGQVGVEDTLAACDKYGIDHIGGGKNIEDAQRVLFKTINGQKLAIVNVCENEWSIAGGDHGGSASLNPVRNYYAIQEACEKADYVVVIVHGGIEGYQYPTPRMQETYRFFVDAGADAVINHHQHCFSGYEIYKGKPVFYGLGNFCFDRQGQRNSAWNDGYMVLLHFEGASLDFETIPYTQCNEVPAVVPLDEKSKSAFDNRIKSINDIIGNEELLQREFHRKTESLYEYRLSALEPFGSKFVKKLQKRHLFPRFIKEEQLKAMLMRANCESNRDTFVGVLKKHFKI